MSGAYLKEQLEHIDPGLELNLHWFDLCEVKDCKICQRIAEDDFKEHGIKYNKSNISIDYGKEEATVVLVGAIKQSDLNSLQSIPLSFMVIDQTTIKDNNTDMVMEQIKLVREFKHNL